MPKKYDLIGKTFGDLEVIGLAPNILYGDKSYRAWLCRCTCGREKPVITQSLTKGLTRSCGCGQGWFGEHPLKHGECAGGGSPEYRIWSGMISRCHNPDDPSYADYGGRGIFVCARWREDVRNFVEDVGRRPSPDHTLDREDNDGPYSPDNYRWATYREQQQNRRDNVMHTRDGETLCLAEWARKLGIRPSLITNRMARGWTIEEALTPPRKGWSRQPGATTRNV